MTRRSRSYVLVLAHLALVAYLFQIAALDHWHADARHVVGIEGTSAHAQHCHGGSGCADAAASAAVLTPSVSGPIAPALNVASHLADAQPQLSNSFLEVPSGPPRAA